MAKGQIRFFYFESEENFNDFISKNGRDEDYLYLIGNENIGKLYKGNQLIAQAGKEEFSLVNQALKSLTSAVETQGNIIGIKEIPENETNSLYQFIVSLQDQKVDKETGKGLSEANFTQTEKEKLAGIAIGATAIEVDSELADSANPVQNRVIKAALDTKASKVELSTKASKEDLENLTATDVGAENAGAINTHNNDDAAHTSIQSRINTNTTNITGLSGQLTTHINDDIHLTESIKKQINDATNYVNKNHVEKAFKTISVGNVAISAEDRADNLVLKAGTGVTLSANTSDNSITINSLDGVASVTTGTKDGTIHVDGVDVEVKGLKSMAYQDANSFTDGLKTSVKSEFVDPHTTDTNIHFNGTDRSTLDKVPNLETTLNNHTKASNPHNITAATVGLGNVENKNSTQILNGISKNLITSKLGYTPYTPTEIDNKLDGKANSSHQQAASTINVDPLKHYTSSNVQAALKAMETDIQANKTGLTSTTIHGKALTGNITLSADEVGAAKKDHIHDNYVNQPAFSNVKVGSTTIEAETVKDTLEIIADTGISITSDATNDKVTIANSGVRSISTGSTNGTISVNTGGTSDDVAVKGLGSAAYTNSDAYDAKDSAKNAKAEAIAEAIAEAKEYTDGKIQSLIGAAPETLDTLGELATAFKDNKDVVDALKEAITNKVDNDHLTASNPHGITKATVGLSNVENKSVATIKSEILTSENIENTLGYMPPAPYGIAKSDTLGLVKSGGDITINATTGQMSVKNDSHTHTLSKISDFPVKRDELSKLSGLTVDSAKINLLADADSNIQAQLNDKSNNNHDHNDATASTHGFMSTADKTKLNNISDNANKVEFSQIIKEGDSGAVAIGTITIDGTSHKIYGKNTDTDTHLTSTNALDTTSGGALLKHYESDRSTATSTHTILGSGGTTVSVNNDKDTLTISSPVYSVATSTSNGLMPSEFYEKLKNINASKLVYSDVSTNLVQASGTTFGLVNSNIDTSSLDDEFSICPIKDGKVYYKDTNTIYSGTDGINVDGNKITNAGVRSISTGGKDGTISVNTNGTSTDIAVKGLGSAAYTNSDAYASKTHEHDQVYLKISAKASTAEEADTASTLGNATIGSRSMPIYLDEGTPKLCDQMPVAANNHVTQTNTTENGAYRVLLSGSANNTSETTTAKKSGNLTFNPSTGVLNATQISIGGGATLSWNGEALVISFS